MSEETPAGNQELSDTAHDTGDTGDAALAVKVRGIYTTAITHLLCETDGCRVVQASPPIRERFDAALPTAPADAVVTTTDDRLGVGVTGTQLAVERVVERLQSVGRDSLAWADPMPRGAVFAGELVEELGGGAVVDLGDGEAFLPYSKTERRVGSGDRLRVQVREASAPWTGGRPVLDTTVRVQSPLGTLVRGGVTDTGGPELADILPTDPPEGWGITWDRAADDADLDALAGTLDGLGERATAFDEAFSDAPAPTDAAPHRYWTDEATTWLWFGRESRFGLDEARRAVTATMPGHHRVKAGTERASAAVDFVEAVCPDATADGDQEFPFDAVTRQFGPTVGDTVTVDHGKPDGRCYTLGEAEVTSREADGTVVVEREMQSHGTYDGLGTDREPGDTATTKLTEGKWWYPTVYASADGERRGTYVNICTPVEVFPASVRYVDLHVDVVKQPDGTIERVDDDELDAAVAAGDVPAPLAEKARSVASALENAL